MKEILGADREHERKRRCPWRTQRLRATQFDGKPVIVKSDADHPAAFIFDQAADSPAALARQIVPATVF